MLTWRPSWRPWSYTRTDGGMAVLTWRPSWRPWSHTRTDVEGWQYALQYILQYTQYALQYVCEQV